MSSVPWSNETERADHYNKLYNEQLAICDRLQEEIDRKNAKIEEMHQDVKTAEEYALQMKTEKDNLIKTYKECQAEAIKEFSERAKAELMGWETDPTDEEIEFTIDQIAKEMGVEL